jgi:hypothetical protein
MGILAYLPVTVMTSPTAAALGSMSKTRGEWYNQLSSYWNRHEPAHEETTSFATTVTARGLVFPYVAMWVSYLLNERGAHWNSLKSGMYGSTDSDLHTIWLTVECSGIGMHRTRNDGQVKNTSKPFGPRLVLGGNPLPRMITRVPPLREPLQFAHFQKFLEQEKLC